ncbi:MAG: phosphotransferase [Patescibacteria group bacterium]
MRRIYILSEKNIAEYLLNQVNKSLPFRLLKITEVTEITKYTNASFVYRVHCITNQGKKTLFLKQSDGYTKRNRRIRVDPERVIIEGEKLKLLESLFGKGIVPLVLYVDLKNYILVMDDIQGKKKILIEEFDQHKVYPQLARKFGIFFGTLHGKTYNTPPVFNRSAWQKRIYRLWRNWILFGAKKILPDKTIRAFIRQSDRAKKSLIWGDPVNKNIFVNRQNFSVLDFDFAMYHDPALDNGVFLAHWVIKMLEGKKKIAIDCRNFIINFTKAYLKTTMTMGLSVQERDGIMKRTIVWTGVYMVSRTDGRSGSYYKKSPVWESQIRETGLALITKKKNNTADWFRKALTK